MSDAERPLVTAQVVTRHPEDYQLRNLRDGTVWRIDPETGYWTRFAVEPVTPPPLNADWTKHERQLPRLAVIDEDVP